MSYSFKTLSSSTAMPPSILSCIDNFSNPVVLTYTTGSPYNATTSPGAKIFLLDLDGKYGLRNPIIVILKEERENEYIACFEEAALSRSGETAQEAIDWLKSSIVTLYNVLRKKDPKKLGPLPARQLKVLGDYLVAESNPKA